MAEIKQDRHEEGSKIALDTPTSVLADAGVDVSLEEATRNNEAAEIEALKRVLERPADPEIQGTGRRLREDYPSDPVVLPPGDKQLITETADHIATKLSANYEPGFGISPCDAGNFSGQVWSRDLAHGIGNGEFAPVAVLESLQTIFDHQRPDGQLPLRVERVIAPLRLIPGIGNWLSKTLFRYTKEGSKGLKERGIYKGQDLSGGEDTVPAILIAVGEFFLNTAEGKIFAGEHYEKIKKAIKHFETKIDSEDGLAVLSESPDWAETIKREGKLGTINIWWARALRLMSVIARQLGHGEDATEFKEAFKKVKASILEKLYHKEGAYFRTGEAVDRVDTVASIFGALYLLDASEAARVEETLSSRVKRSSGLVNFDPPYEKNQIHAVPRLFLAGYHNEAVWPWVTCQNIQVKIKIALQHKDAAIRQQYKQEAMDDLVAMAKLFEKAGGAYEIVQPDQPSAMKGSFYHPPQNFTGTLAAYQSAYLQLKQLDWI